jgi:hypothetical protein
VAVVGGALVLLAILALSGFSPAAHALPFVTGALVGSLAARLMTRPGAPRGIQASAIFLAALTLVLAGIVLISPLMDVDWVSGFWRLDSWAALFIGGFTFLFFFEIFRRVAFPSHYPSTYQERQRQRHEQLRGALVFGGLTLALLVGASVVFGVIALVAYAVGQFSG